MYKYEIHLHTSACSACATSSAIEMVEEAKEKGYAGLVFTNHFYHGNSAIDRELPWHEFVKSYYDDYLIGKKSGNKIGVDVLFGLEEGYGNGKEALIYGIDPLLLMETPEFKNMTLEEKSAFVRGNGGFFACAHPFRVRSYISNPNAEPNLTCFDAVESYNAGNSIESNEKAAHFCEDKDVLQISGGDVHHFSSIGKAGLAFLDRISTEQQLVSALKSGNYRLIKNGKIE